MSLPLVEKYRPTVLDDVVGNQSAVDRLRAIQKDGNLLHLIISGPPGCGKTTSIGCLARSLLGDKAGSAVLELNASDDRGIDVVREKIKSFAKQKVAVPENRHKIVILDEADAMTAAAQQALRRTMEIFSSTTRFALACNISTKIIEPIQSRCAIIRFSKLSDKDILSRLRQVVEAEQIPFDDGGLEALVFTADGDMRHALNNLQSTHNGFGRVSREAVFKVCDQPHPSKIRSCIQCCLENRTGDAYNVLRQLWDQGYGGVDIVGVLFRVMKLQELPEYLKCALLKEVGLTQMRLEDGAAPTVQLAGLMAKMSMVARNSRD
mmetsp:Transcript_19376/g.46663  ORF Transcript_19376/g.46663 Transcript_19376/m.46663 type:complete len:321 (-) Transcript_19376:33-995(-)